MCAATDACHARQGIITILSVDRNAAAYVAFEQIGKSHAAVAAAAASAAEAQPKARRIAAQSRPDSRAECALIAVAGRGDGGAAHQAPRDHRDVAAKLVHQGTAPPHTQPSVPGVDTPPWPQALFEAVGRDKNGYFTRADALAVLDQYIAER